MAYRKDEDLEFLGEMKSKDLHDLVESLTKDKDGNVRLAEELTTKDIYKKNYPDHAKYWELMAAEIQCFGANSFATVLRGGKGVLYREVLRDVCDKSKVNYNEKQATKSIEGQLLIKLLGDAMEKMSESDRVDFAKLIGFNTAKTFSPESMMAAAQAAFTAGGFQSYRVALMVANGVSRAVLGRGLTFAANATLTRTLSIISGPIGWAITGAWTAIDLAGPAFRVTLPAVIQVALLRQKHQAEVDGLWAEIEKEMRE